MTNESREQKVNRLKTEYPEGTRIRLIKMNDIQAPPMNTCGTVSKVDDIGNIMVRWDNGSSLSLLEDEDEFEKRIKRRGKATNKYAKFNKQSSINQQNAYLKLADEIKEKYKNINVVMVDNCRPEATVKEEIKKLLEWKEE